VPLLRISIQFFGTFISFRVVLEGFDATMAVLCSVSFFRWFHGGAEPLAHVASQTQARCQVRAHTLGEAT
jgi:hypothetical protein